MRAKAAFDGVLFDIDGVLVTSWRPLPGAAQAVAAVDGAGLRRAFLTNTTSRTRAEIASALTAAGIGVHVDEVVTAAALTAEYLRLHHPGARCFVLNSGDIAEDMPDVEFTDDDPDVVVLGGAGPEFTHDALSRVYRWMADGVPAVAMHRGMMWQTADGPRVDTGLYQAGLEAALRCGIPAIGKPSPAGFLAAASHLGVDPEAVVMVGDDLHVDVLAAQSAGLTGVLVRTGKFSQRALDEWLREENAVAPAHVIDSVADLPSVLGVGAPASGVD